jgi:type I restriction enzyme, R subunit
MFGNGEQAKIGSITSRWEHFHEWKRLAEDEPGVVDMETLLKGVCDKRTFLDWWRTSSCSTSPPASRRRSWPATTSSWASTGRSRRCGSQERGWASWACSGTPRAGKSYSMVMFTRKVHRKLGGNFTFLVLTDRDDLDTQIYKTFAGCGVVDNDRDPAAPPAAII